ncbi:hypothetical protein [Candidatus Nitrospira bockiana]
MNRRDAAIAALLALLGLVVWLSASLLSGQREAWDSPYFANLGVPILAFAAAGAGFLRPARPWLWSVCPVLLQPVALYWGHPPLEGEFGPLGLLVFLIYALVFFASAKVGEWLRRHILA